MWYITLKIPGVAIMIGGFAESNDTGFARAQMPDDPLDGTIFTSRITAFEKNKYLEIVFDQMPLQLDKFDLKVPESVFISACFDLIILLLRFAHVLNSLKFRCVMNGLFQAVLTTISCKISSACAR